MQLQIGLAHDPNILRHRVQECSGVIQLRVRVSASVVPHSLCPESASYTVSLGSTITKCRTLWGEREQAACFLATEERMLYQMLLIVSKVTIVVVVAKIYSVRF